ncbi:pentatricopeptide repeat-containing protein [Tanacetum coccineum]
MYNYALEFGIIHVYITHGPQDLAPYYVENMFFYGSEDDLKPRKTVTKDAGNMSLEDLVSWAEEEVTMSSKASDVDICVTSVLDKGKGLADKGKGIMVYEGKAGRKTARSRNNGIVIGENVNPSVSEDDDSDSDIEWEQRVKGNAELEEMYVGISDSESEYSDKSVDHLSEGEDELISLRKRNSEAKKNPTVIKHEEYMDMDILMHQLRGKSDGLLDPFTILENDQSNDRYPIHDDQTHWKMRKPKVGEKYVDAAQLKECLTYYALANGFSLWLYRSSKEMIIARCGRRPEKLKSIQKGKQRKHLKYPSSSRNEGSNCPFRCYVRMMTTESSFQVIFLKEDHTCVRDFKYRNLVNYKWIAKHFGHKVRQNPEIKLHEIADLVLKKYKCIVSQSQCRYAKTKALNEGDLTIQEHYALIRSYGKEILDSNDGSTVKLTRHVISLDGCFLKKPHVGEILTAVGRDGNNHIYLIAWAVVNVENKDNWSWFLELLGEDIDMPTGNGLTLISDQNKVWMIEVVKDVCHWLKHRTVLCQAIYEGFIGINAMRVIVMERLNTMRQIFEKWTGDICPNIQKRLELNKDKHRFWHVIPAGGNLFEVRNG